MWRNSPGEDRDQHVERQEDLRQTDPNIQDLLELPKASNKEEDFIKIHFSGFFVDAQSECAADQVRVSKSAPQRELPGEEVSVKALRYKTVCSTLMVHR